MGNVGEKPFVHPSAPGHCPSHPWGTAKHGNHLISQFLPSFHLGSPPHCSTKPSHGSLSLMCDPHPWCTVPAPDGFWALPSYTHCDESRQPLTLSWWPAGGWQASPSAQAAHPIRQTVGAPAVSPQADCGAGWDTEPAPHHRVTPCQIEPALLQPGQGIWMRCGNSTQSSKEAHEDIMIKYLCIYYLRDQNNPVFLLFQLAVWKSLYETDQICNDSIMEKIAGMSCRVFNSWRFMTIALFLLGYSGKNSNEG